MFFSMVRQEYRGTRIFKDEISKLEMYGTLLRIMVKSNRISKSILCLTIRHKNHVTKIVVYGGLRDGGVGIWI